MELGKILKALNDERETIDHAIATLEHLAAGRGRRPHSGGSALTAPSCSPAIRLLAAARLRPGLAADAKKMSAPRIRTY